MTGFLETTAWVLGMAVAFYSLDGTNGLGWYVFSLWFVEFLKSNGWLG